jgi:hypothetical protein
MTHWLFRQQLMVANWRLSSTSADLVLILNQERSVPGTQILPAFLVKLLIINLP